MLKYAYIFLILMTLTGESAMGAAAQPVNPSWIKGQIIAYEAKSYAKNPEIPQEYSADPVSGISMPTGMIDVWKIRVKIIECKTYENDETTDSPNTSSENPRKMIAAHYKVGEEYKFNISRTFKINTGDIIEGITMSHTAFVPLLGVKSIAH